MPDTFIQKVDAFIQRVVPTAGGREINSELVGSMGAIGEIPLEHQNIHVETKGLATGFEQGAVSLTKALFDIIPDLEQRIERLKNNGSIGKLECTKLADDLYVVKKQIVDLVNQRVSEFMLNPEQNLGDNEQLKTKFNRLFLELAETCDKIFNEKQ